MQPDVAALKAKIASLESALALRTEQLLASTARSYSFLDSINKGFIMCDTTGELVLSNQALRAIMSRGQPLGTPEESLSIDMIAQRFHPALNLKQLITDCLQTRRTTELQNVVIDSVNLHIYITPLLSSDGAEQNVLGVILLVEDVTEQKMLERSKDEFLSIASHELRTPLTAIRGNTSLIQKYYSGDMNNPEVAEMITDIHDSSVRLIGIVNDFLDLAVLEQGKIEIKPEQFAMQTVVEEVFHELRSLAEEKHVQLVTDTSLQSVPMVVADRQRIKQVIVNLTGNALKFTETGSITISAAAEGAAVRVFVTDSGKGMPPENQKYLFHKFQQAGGSLLTRDTAKGTGLGLYISKLIIELSGGSIRLDKSEPSVGTTFSFTLPGASSS